MKTAVVWFRNDLRLQSNPALQAAISAGYRVLAVYIDERTDLRTSASSWWNHYALAELAQSIESIGGQLALYQGESKLVLQRVIDANDISAVFWNRRYTPVEMAQDTALKTVLKDQGITVSSFNGSLLLEPWTLLNKSGKPYRVFTPYWRACVEKGLPIPADDSLEVINWASVNDSLTLRQLNMLSEIGWDSEFGDHWKPSREHALQEFHSFIDIPIENYDADRDRPDRAGTTRLSPFLRSGMIGVGELIAILEDPKRLKQESVEQAHGRRKLVAELGWREFSTYLLYHFPHCLDQPMRANFNHFPWKKDQDLLNAWQRGKTGYPIIDAGMMELWHTGWMHNRVRMIVASFLVKHLMQPWQEGADWFMQTLVDADIASNTQGWQWTAGCGADASPFFRVFNPVGQGKKFDPNGEYVRRWLPQLKDVPKKYIHEPWLMDQRMQQASSCNIDEHYPTPIVDLKEGRERALDAWQGIRNTS